MNSIHCIRLHRSDDIMLTIQEYVKKHHIQAGVILSGVGCVYEAHIRDASGIKERTIQENMEIVSMTGTVGENRCHVHISFSKEDLSTIGGHLMKGTYVNTTLELVILEIEKTLFLDEYDPQTGYGEWVVKEL